jgi:hypothetical protein
MAVGTLIGRCFERHERWVSEIDRPIGLAINAFVDRLTLWTPVRSVSLESVVARTR